MRVIPTLAFCMVVGSGTAFTVSPQRTSVSLQSPSAVRMGLFDFFSEETRQKREEKRRREIEEQERLQKAIMERRKNPEKMEEYERKVMLRRQLRMQGKDEAAAKIEIYDDEVDKNTLLDGTKGSL